MNYCLTPPGAVPLVPKKFHVAEGHVIPDVETFHPMIVLIRRRPRKSDIAIAQFPATGLNAVLLTRKGVGCKAAVVGYETAEAST